MSSLQISTLTTKLNQITTLTSALNTNLTNLTHNIIQTPHTPDHTIPDCHDATSQIPKIQNIIPTLIPTTNLLTNAITTLTKRTQSLQLNALQQFLSLRILHIFPNSPFATPLLIPKLNPEPTSTLEILCTESWHLLQQKFGKISHFQSERTKDGTYIIAITIAENKFFLLRNNTNSSILCHSSPPHDHKFTQPTDQLEYDNKYIQSTAQTEAIKNTLDCIKELTAFHINMYTAIIVNDLTFKDFHLYVTPIECHQYAHLLPLKTRQSACAHFWNHIKQLHKSAKVNAIFLSKETKRFIFEIITDSLPLYMDITLKSTININFTSNNKFPLTPNFIMFDGQSYDKTYVNTKNEQQYFPLIISDNHTLTAFSKLHTFEYSMTYTYDTLNRFLGFYSIHLKQNPNEPTQKWPLIVPQSAPQSSTQKQIIIYSINFWNIAKKLLIGSQNELLLEGIYKHITNDIYIINIICNDRYNIELNLETNTLRLQYGHIKKNETYHHINSKSYYDIYMKPKYDAFEYITNIIQQSKTIQQSNINQYTWYLPIINNTPQITTPIIVPKLLPYSLFRILTPPNAKALSKIFWHHLIKLFKPPHDASFILDNMYYKNKYYYLFNVSIVSPNISSYSIVFAEQIEILTQYDASNFSPLTKFEYEHDYIVPYKSIDIIKKNLGHLLYITNNGLIHLKGVDLLKEFANKIKIYVNECEFKSPMLIPLKFSSAYFTDLNDNEKYSCHVRCLQMISDIKLKDIRISNETIKPECYRKYEFHFEFDNKSYYIMFDKIERSGEMSQISQIQEFTLTGDQYKDALKEQIKMNKQYIAIINEYNNITWPKISRTESEQDRLQKIMNLFKIYIPANAPLIVKQNNPIIIAKIISNEKLQNLTQSHLIKLCRLSWNHIKKYVNNITLVTMYKRKISQGIVLPLHLKANKEYIVILNPNTDAQIYEPTKYPKEQLITNPTQYNELYINYTPQTQSTHLIYQQ